MINRHPMVEESLVYGVPHPRFGEIPAAKVRLAGGSSSEEALKELRRFCYQGLASYKVPKEFVFVDFIEKTASGKIVRGQGPVTVFPDP